MADFKSLADVEAWVNLRGLDGERALRENLAANRFGERNAQMAKLWLEHQDREAGSAVRSEQREFDDRSLAAAETAARASVDAVEQARRSADAAEDSALWAKWALVAAVAALVVAAWPYIKDVGR